jgi:hypothetical protein
MNNLADMWADPPISPPEPPGTTVPFDDGDGDCDDWDDSWVLNSLYGPEE